MAASFLRCRRQEETPARRIPAHCLSFLPRAPALLRRRPAPVPASYPRRQLRKNSLYRSLSPGLICGSATGG
jgi:hypothetical protein